MSWCCALVQGLFAFWEEENVQETCETKCYNKNIFEATGKGMAKLGQNYNVVQRPIKSKNVKKAKDHR